MKSQFSKEYRRADFEFSRTAPKGRYWEHEKKSGWFDAVLVAGGFACIIAIMFVAAL